MPDKHQFTLKWLLVEVALVALGLGLARVVYSDAGILVFFAGWGSFACFGAFVGGFFGRFGIGAVAGVVVLVALQLLFALLYPVAFS